jgi:hypothetical protein
MVRQRSLQNGQASPFSATGFLQIGHGCGFTAEVYDGRVRLWACLALLLGGCGGATTLLVDVALAPGEPVPQQIELWIYDATRALVSGWTVSGSEGAIVIGGFRDEAQVLRVMVHGRGGTTLVRGGALVTTVPGGRARALVTLASLALDSDGDGVIDALDNCISVANPEQQDSDGDRIGDACAVGGDLAATDDLAPPDDLATPPEDLTGADLTGADLTSADLTTAPADLAMRDMVVPPDMTPVISILAGNPAMGGHSNGTGMNALFDEPDGITTDGAGNVYVTDRLVHVIRKIVVATQQVTTLAGMPYTTGTVDGTGTAARFDTPTGIAWRNTGHLYVTDRNNHCIRRVDVSNGQVETFAGQCGTQGSVDNGGTGARFAFPNGCAEDPVNDVLYVADFSNQTIRKLVHANGAVTTYAGAVGITGSTDGAVATARFNNPYGLSYEPGGFIWVADSLNNTVRRIDLGTNMVSTVAGTALQSGTTNATGTAARFNRPFNVAAAPGRVFVNDFNNNLIRAIALPGAAVTTYAGTAGSMTVTLGALPGSFPQPKGSVWLPAGGLAVTLTTHAVLLIR